MAYNFFMVMMMIYVVTNEYKRFKSKDEVVAIGKLGKGAGLALLFSVGMWGMLAYSLGEEMYSSREARAYFEVGVWDFVDTTRVEGIVEESNEKEKEYAQWNVKEIKEARYLALRVMLLGLLLLVCYRNSKYRFEKNGIRFFTNRMSWDAFKSYDIERGKVTLVFEIGRRITIEIDESDEGNIRELLERSI